MKTLELYLKNKIFIVELSRRMEYLLHKDELHFLLDGIHLREIKYGKYKLICEGSELNEEIAEGLIVKVMGNNHYQNYNPKGIIDRWCKTALESFISAIEAQGMFWEKPLGISTEEIRQRHGDASDMFKEWIDYESCTFNPEKTLIFEIL